MAGQPLRSMLYAGATTKIIGHTEVWFNGKHTVDPTRKPGYKSNDPVAIAAQTKTLQEAGLDILMYNWYGEGSYEDECTQNYFNVSPLGHIINIDGGIIGSLAALQGHVAYIRKTYFPHAGYEKFNGKYIVTYFVKEGNNVEWFRQVEAENPDIIFVYNGPSWGKSQMAWIKSNLQADCDNFCKAYSARNDGNLYIPCFAAGFNDLNSLTGIGVWGDNPARIWPAGGPNWNTLEAYFTTINRYYSTSNQLHYLQGVTVNDEDEGSGMLSRGFLLPEVQPKASHLEVWVDGTKLGDLNLLVGQKLATINEVSSAGVILGSTTLTLK